MSQKEVQAQWLDALNYRLQLDLELMKEFFENRALLKLLVLEKWMEVLVSRPLPGEDWTELSGVLVGMPRPTIDQ